MLKHNNLLEDKMSKTIEDVCIGVDFLKVTPIAQEVTSSKINKWDHIELRFCIAKKTISRAKNRKKCLLFIPQRDD